MKRRFTDLRRARQFPNEVLLFSDAQFRQQQAPPVESQDPDEEAHVVPSTFDPVGEDGMVAGVVAARPALQVVCRPSMLGFFYNDPAAYHADLGGCAAGNTVREAIVKASSNLWKRWPMRASGGTTSIAAGGSGSQ